MQSPAGLRKRVRALLDGPDIEITRGAAFAVVGLTGFVGGLLGGVIGCWLYTVVLVNSDVTDTLRVAILTSIPVLARVFGALRDSLGLIQEPGGASA